MFGTHITCYKLPRRWLWWAELPKTALGKLQKSSGKRSSNILSQRLGCLLWCVAFKYLAVFAD